MLYRLIFLVFFLSTGLPLVATAQNDAGIESRIANGVEEFGQPSVVTLIDPSDGFPFCSGVMIGCSTVLTAAHCVCNSNGTNCQQGNPGLISAEDVAIAFQHQQTMAVNSIHVPQDYVFGSKADLAIIKLTGSVDGIRPTPINDSVFVNFNTPGTISGYGITQQSFSDNGIKRSGDMVTAACPSNVPDDEHLCWLFPGINSAGPPGTDSNTCPGDSGGPMFMDFGSGQRVAAVTSGGPNACHTSDNPFDTDIFVNRDYVKTIGGNDLNNTSCGILPQVGDVNTTVQGFSGTINSSNLSERQHSYTVPAGTKQLRVILNGTSEGIDVDLYLRFGAQPTDELYDCRPFLEGNFEACVIDNPTPGIWHARIKSFNSSNAIKYHLVYTLFSGESGGGSGDASFGNISYNGFVPSTGIKPAWIQTDTAQVVITAETLGLPDPRITLKRLSDNSTIAFNDTCNIPNLPDLIGKPVGTPSQDACLQQTLAKGAYYIEVAGSGGTASGDVLASVTQPNGSSPALQNISYNGFVSSNGIRPAFIVANTTEVVITAESLGLPNPRVSLKRVSDNSTIQFNDNCANPSISALIGRPLNTPLDACIVINGLPAGSYYVEVSDVNGNNGNALVSVTQVLD